ncbi:MAG: TrmH family RNA methyltransferase [Oscillospiraceae bacterium]
MQLKKYKKEFAHSYALGPFPCFELLESAPEQALEVYASPEFNDLEKLREKCAGKNIPLVVGGNALSRISEKENCYAAGVFQKYNLELRSDKPHVVLHNPADMGNLGTILRTLLGFGIRDLAIIQPAADVFHPKVVRASMGALFRMRFMQFENFSEYLTTYGDKRDIFPFMLDGSKQLSLENCPHSNSYSLVFGNEARGLPPEFSQYGTAIFIPQSPEVDSLNLAVSVAVGSFVFTTVNHK